MESKLVDSMQGKTNKKRFCIKKSNRIFVFYRVTSADFKISSTT